MFQDFEIIDYLIKIVNEDLITIANCSLSTSCQIKHHEGNVAIIYYVYVQTNLTFNRTINVKDFKFLQ